MVGVWGLGHGAQGLGFSDESVGCMVYGGGLRAEVLG